MTLDQVIVIGIMICCCMMFWDLIWKFISPKKQKKGPCKYKYICIGCGKEVMSDIPDANLLCRGPHLNNMQIVMASMVKLKITSEVPDGTNS